jgi:hypothetical protein
MIDLGSMLRDLPGDGERLLRDVAFPARTKWPRSRVRDVRFERVDFDAPLLGGFFSRPVIARCQFRDCRFGGMNAVKTAFRECSSTNTVFGGDAYCALKQCTFERCTFDGCVWESVGAFACSVAAAQWRSTRWRNVRFERSFLLNFVLEGQLSGIAFVGSALENGSLAGCAFRELSFVDHSTVSGVTFPSTPENFVLTDLGIFGRAEQQLALSLTEAELAAYREDVDFLRQTGMPICLDEASFEAIPRARRERVMSVLQGLSEGAAHGDRR